jgi:hypothetical protein
MGRGIAPASRAAGSPAGLAAREERRRSQFLGSRRRGVDSRRRRRCLNTTPVLLKHNTQRPDALTPLSRAANGPPGGRNAADQIQDLPAATLRFLEQASSLAARACGVDRMRGCR